MKLNPTTISQLALHLHDCELNAVETHKITDDHPDMDWDDAYAIQDQLFAFKTARGLKRVGLKAGLTSFAKMRQMGVESPVFGFMTEDALVADHGTCPVKGLIHPKVEPEIAFVTGKELSGPGCTVAQVLDATAYVLPGMEVIDSRYLNFKFDLKSVIADNTSAARFVIGGKPTPVRGLDLRTVGIVMEKNGKPVAFGAGAAVLGNPANAIAALANHLGRRGHTIPAGTLILSGGITEAVAVAAGDTMTLHVQGMGCTALSFV
jgi:2-oxo-3-hexenedioate decarboxylase